MTRLISNNRSPREPAMGGRHAARSRSGRRGLGTLSVAAGLLLLAFLAVTALHATSPRGPIELSETGDPWRLYIQCQATSFTDFYLKRTFLYFGEKISEDEMPLAVEPDDNGIGHLSFSFGGGLGTLEDGVYCQVVEIGARRIGREHGYVSRHHLRFEVVDGSVRPLSLKEYSDLVDPVATLPGPNGKPEIVHLGHIVERQVPFGTVNARPARQVDSGHDPESGLEDFSEKDE